MAEEFVTILAVIRHPHAAEDPVDALALLTSLTEDEVLFLSCNDGVTNEALTLGAEPAVWPGDDEEVCDLCGDSPVRGAIAGMDFPAGIQRCDTCDLFPGDLEAALALAQAVGGVACFYAEGDNTGDPDSWTVQRTFDGTDPGEVLIADRTNPWVEINGKPVDWDERRRQEAVAKLIEKGQARG